MKVPVSNQSVSDLIAPLADAARLRLLRLLEREELSVGEASRVVQLPQSTVSRHLKNLAECGWLERRAIGTASYYRSMLDDLTPQARAIWLTVRDQLTEQTSPEVAEDDRRLESVLAERRDDALAFFGRLAGEWDDLRSRLFGGAFTADALLSLLPATWTVADLGCGTGNAAERLAPHVERVIAVDQSEPMLEAARQRCGRLSNVEFRVGDLSDLPVESDTVDACVLVLVLHHLEDPARALAESARVLRTSGGGGRVLVVDMVEHHRQEYRDRLGHIHLGFGERDMRSLMSDVGLELGRFRVLPSDAEGMGPALFAATGQLIG